MARHQQYTITYDLQVNTNKYLQECDDKDVISINSVQWIGTKKLKEIITQAFNKSNGLTTIINYIYSISNLKNSKFWFHGGEECEILRAGSQGWQKGRIKIKVSLEFSPDEPEVEKSPLDDIREAENNNIE